MAEFIDSHEWEINPTLFKNKITFAQGTKPKRIFHYTSITGLQGILEKRTLRFTNINYLNDKDEITAGVESLAKIIDGTDEQKEKLFTPIHELGERTFVCCFSLDEDSLPMWNYYTKESHNQDYNIEFNDRLLVESILLNNPLLEGCELSFSLVEYCKNNHSHYSKIFSNEFNSSLDFAMLNFFSTIAKNISDNDSQLLQEWETRLNELSKRKKEVGLSVYRYHGQTGKFKRDTSGNYLFFVKRECFSPEKELRITITVPPEKLPLLKQREVYKYRISNGVLVPYLELNFSPNAIQGLTISPTTQSDLAEQSIKDFLKYCDCSFDNPETFIKKSKVPVRF